MKFFFQHRSALSLGLASAFLVASLPALAQAAPQNDAPPPPPAAGAQMPQPPRPRRDVPPPPASMDTQRTISGPYRLTYTLTEMDGSKRVGSQHYAIVLDADAPPAHVGIRSTIPVSAGKDSPNYHYENAGFEIDANLRQFSNGMELSTEISQTGFVKAQDELSGTPSSTMQFPPITRSSRLRSTALLSENKPVVLGTVDTPGSTHTLQIKVELTRVP